MSCSVIHFRLCNPMDCSTPGFTISWSLLKLMCIESVMPSKHLILCHLLLILPSIFPSIRVFSSELAILIWQPEYQSFSFSISPSSEYSELISFRIDWFDLLQSTGPSRVFSSTTVGKHHHVLWLSAFFMVQLSRPYMTTRKIIASDF